MPNLIRATGERVFYYYLTEAEWGAIFEALSVADLERRDNAKHMPEWVDLRNRLSLLVDIENELLENE